MADEPYPNLSTCRVVVRGATGVNRPPVTLPQECQQAAESFRIIPLYDFEVENKVLQDAEQRKLSLQQEGKVTTKAKSQSLFSTASATASSWKLPWQ